MKILKIRLKNLNSIVGDYTIDLTKDTYVQRGIFAITGATGAGKTTILDAITLALYGETVRLGRIRSSGGEILGNEIMSRHSSECMAEVTFKVNNKIFHASFAQGRAHDRPDGRLRQADHQIVDEDNKSLLVERGSVADKVEELTGLNFDRFTRTMLLAQGEFAKFLNSNDRDRSELLEELTKTHYYSKLSSKIYDVATKEKSEYELLSKALDDFELLDEEKIEELKNKLRKLQEDQLKVTARQKAVRDKVNLMNNYKKLNQRGQEVKLLLNKEKTTQEEQKDNFEQLRIHQKSEKITSSYNSLQKTRKDKKTLGEKKENIKLHIETLNNELKIEQESSKLLGTSFELAEKEHTRINKLYLESLETERQITELKQKLQSQNIISAKLKKIVKQEELLKAIPKIKKSLKDQIEELEKDVSKLKELRSNADTIRLQAQKIESLEAERHKLISGTPCPLCGAEEHPYCDTIKLPQKTEAEQRYRELDEKFSESTKVLNRLKNDLTIEENKEKDLNIELKELKIELEGDNIDSHRSIEIVAQKIQFLEKELQEKRQMRGDANYKELEAKASELLSKKRKEMDAKEKNYNQQEKNKANFTGQLAELAKTYKNIEDELEVLDKDFKEQLFSNNFSNETQYLESKLPAEKAKEIKTLEEYLIKQINSLQTELSLIEQQIEQQKITEDDLKKLPQLEEELKTLDFKLEDKLTTIGQFRERLDNDNKNRQKFKEQQRNVEKQHSAMKRWQLLNELIGSRDGQKYRNFVQGLTFENLLVHANNQLKTLTPRYSLCSDSKEPLQINVMDHDQAGEERPAKTLSGGESFIVSLALALGLSDLVGDRIQIDTLFLDEGFGALDENSLETALSALATLQRRGKLVGIISHVPLIKDRIPNQIKVIKRGAGRSRIEGPGCVENK